MPVDPSLKNRVMSWIRVRHSDAWRAAIYLTSCAWLWRRGGTDLQVDVALRELRGAAAGAAGAARGRRLGQARRGLLGRRLVPVRL